MKASRKQKQAPPAFGQLLSLFVLVLGPTSAIASCSSETPSPGNLGEEQLAQFTCGGRGVGGISITGGSISRGGTGGFSGCPPSDTCSTWSCQLGTCRATVNQMPGDTCTAADDSRGHCGIFTDPDRNQTLSCCVGGCLDSRDNCVTFGNQDDQACGRLGNLCKDCGECRTCSSTGTCVATTGSCMGGVCANGSCCTGCIAGDGQCYVNALDNCGSSGGTCMSCNDNNSCTTDSCSNGACQHSNVDGACDDGDECTINDTCNGSTCRGTAKNCDDGDPCTRDSCTAGTGCTHAPDPGKTCNDQNVCTTGDTCNAQGVCTGTMVNCNDGNQCTDDTCSAGSGCVHTSKPEGAACDDGSPCSTGDRCHDDDNSAATPRVCEPTAGPNCEDGNPCTSDAADCNVNPPTCPHAPINNGSACSTGTLCTVGQTCMAGACQGGTAVACNDGDPCTSDTCVPATGCSYAAGNDGATCNDGNICTLDDACDKGECVGEPVECVAIDSCHDAGTCDADTGTCNDPRKRDGSPCGTTGTCMSGVCQGDGVVGTGGTGNGTSGEGPGGNGPGNGGTGAGGTGTAGDGVGNSGGDEATGGTATSGAGGTSASGGTDTTPLYKREPGGCACRLGASKQERSGYELLAFASVLALGARRRRRAA